MPGVRDRVDAEAQRTSGRVPAEYRAFLRLPCLARDVRGRHDPLGHFRSTGRRRSSPLFVRARRDAFQTETAAFQKSGIYEETAGGVRAKSTRSFQLGLAGGIRTKLVLRKAERTETWIKASGRDLVPVKASLVEEELAKLGLNFTSQSQRGRMVLPDAYKAGEVAAQRFEAEIELQRRSTGYPDG